MSISRMSRGGARRPSCFIRDTNGQALACAYFEDEPERRAAAHLPTRDEARRIAANSPSCRGGCGGLSDQVALWLRCRRFSGEQA